MKYGPRVMVSLFVVLATYFYITMPLLFVPFIQQGWIVRVISLVCAIGVGWYVWHKLRSVPSGLVSSVLSGGLILGVIALCAGFFGPIIFRFGGNLGPLLGIFITGPLGFLFGLFGGFIYWRIKRKKGEMTTVAKNPL